MTRKILWLFPIFLFIACTQIIDEENPYMEFYKGDDGCLVCHTNESRLQALTPSENGGGPPDGG